MKLLMGVLLLAFVSLSWGQLLFEDDFSDGNYDGWYTDIAPDVTYEVNGDGRFEFTYSGGDDWGIACRSDGGQVMSTRDYSVRVEVIAHDSTTHLPVHIRTNPLAGRWVSYSLYLNYWTDRYYIIRYDSFSEYEVITPTMVYPGGFEHDSPYWIRFECMLDTLRGKIWEGGTGDEPANWMITATDANYYTFGCLGLEGTNSQGDYFNVEFDNVEVTGFAALQPATWGAIKATFE